MTDHTSRPAPVRLDVVRCPECAACLDLDPLLMARDLAIVSALLQEIDVKQSANVKELLDKLARRSIVLCTDLGSYGYETLVGEEESE